MKKDYHNMFSTNSEYPYIERREYVEWWSIEGRHRWQPHWTETHSIGYVGRLQNWSPHNLWLLKWAHNPQVKWRLTRYLHLAIDEDKQSGLICEDFCDVGSFSVRIKEVFHCKAKTGDPRIITKLWSFSQQSIVYFAGDGTNPEICVARDQGTVYDMDY